MNEYWAIWDIEDEKYFELTKVVSSKNGSWITSICRHTPLFRDRDEAVAWLKNRYGLIDSQGNLFSIFSIERVSITVKEK